VIYALAILEGRFNVDSSRPRRVTGRPEIKTFGTAILAQETVGLREAHRQRKRPSRSRRNGIAWCRTAGTERRISRERSFGNSRLRSTGSCELRQTGIYGHVGATMCNVAPGLVEIAICPGAAISQQHGFVHAGAVSAIADTAAGYAALTLMPPNRGILTTEFKINLLAPLRAIEL
jgi:hypothetical protein